LTASCATGADAKGFKESKSKGNYTPPDLVLRGAMKMRVTPSNAVQPGQAGFKPALVRSLDLGDKERLVAAGPGGATPAARGSAVAALRLGLAVLTRLFAPVLPFITEDVWSWAYAEDTGHPSVHRAPWPSAEDFKGIASPASPASFDIAITAQSAINKRKTEAGASAGRAVDHLLLAATPATAALLRPVLADVATAVRAAACELTENPTLTEDTVAVLDIRLADRDVSP
jgi:valyl-tRNA synthetase